MFLERLSVFDYNNNKYFKPNGVFNTRSATDSLAMPNCTLGAYLRAHEAMEAEERVKGLARSGSYGFPNAKDWYSCTSFPKGSELRTGSIAVFDGEYGHVAFVERKIDETHALITQSSYNSNKTLRNWEFWSKRIWELKVGKATVTGCGKLIGYIYVPINDIRVARNTARTQIEIKEQMVNVRKSPGLESDVFCQGLYCPMGIYNVIALEDRDDYTWCKIDKDCWVALGSWATLYAPNMEKDLIETLTNTIDELKKEKNSLENKLTNLESKIDDKDTTIKQIDGLVKEMGVILKNNDVDFE